MTIKPFYVLRSFVFTLFLLCTFHLSASHLAGGSIRYEYIGPDINVSGQYLYKIHLDVYRYCGSGNAATYSCGTRPEEVYLHCASSGDSIGPVLLTQKPYVPVVGDRPNARGAKDVSDVCTTRRSGCEVSGGVNGYELFFWEGVVSIPRCQNWRVTYKSCTCCRNAINNFKGGSGTALELFINTNWSPSGSPGAAPANSGPKFYSEHSPIPSSCVGQTVSFAAGAYDVDGDSLAYEMVCPWSATGTGGWPVLNSMNPNTGISCKQPIHGFVLDSITGLMTFTPTTVGAYVVAFYVSEYERCTGILKGKTYREIQFQVAICTNTPPLAVSRMGNIVGNAFLNNQGEIEICEGQLISWDDTLSDPDIADTLLITSNVDSILPGVTMAILSIGKRNSNVVRFSWRAVIGNHPRKKFYLRYTDDKCAIPGTTYHMFKLKINRGVFAGADINVCLGDTATIKADGGFGYTWRSLSGNAIVPGVNWFSQNAANSKIKLKLTKTSVFELTATSLKAICGGAAANCSKVDTIVVKVGKSFSTQITPDTIICYGSSFNLQSSVSNPNWVYNYSWTPSNLFVDAKVKSPKINTLLQNQMVQYMVTSDSGCTRYDSVFVSVSNPFPHDMFITASDTLICQSDTINMTLDYGSVDYGKCELSKAVCIGNNALSTVGSGAIQSVSGQNNTPNIYASRNKSTRTQFLYTAADLKSNGIGAGQINSIAFEIFKLDSLGANQFKGFTIKIGCSSDSKISTLFTQGLKTVYSPKSHTPTLGWNTHTFDQGYAWDGVSNLLVEVCWDNDTSIYSMDHVMSFDALSYASTAHYYSRTSNSACSANSSIGSAMFLLPKTQFGVCQGAKSANFRFKWSAIPTTVPSGFISPTNLESIRISADANTSKLFQVEVMDTAGVCSKTMTRKIEVVSKYNTKPDTLPLLCIDSGQVKLSVATPYNITSPGGKWSGQGIVDDTLGILDLSIAGKGKFFISYEVTGNSCSSKNSTLFSIVGTPKAQISTIDFACHRFGNVPEHELKGMTNTGVFSGFGVDSTVVGGKTQYFIDGTKFNPTTSNPATVNVRFVVNKGCINDTVIPIPVNADWDATYLGVKYYGTPMMTSQFCATGQQDTLCVAGPNPVWKIIGSAQNQMAMTDSLKGYFNPKLINNGSGGKVNIEVENKGFCGNRAAYTLDVVIAPEVRILAENFCFIEPGNCVNSNIAPADRKKQILVRVAKWPYYKIDDKLPNTYVDVVTAERRTTKHQDLIESDKATRWDGSPWMIFPYKCEAAFCQLGIGSYPISYQLAIRYRQPTQIPDSICLSYTDTSIFVSDEIKMNLTADGDLCNNTSVTLKTGAGSKYDFKWSDGSSNETLLTSTAGTYTVTVSSKDCISEDSITLSYCVGLEEIESSLDVQLYPNPTRENIQLKMENAEEPVTLSIFSLTGQLVDKFNFEAQDKKVEALINVSKLPAGVYSFVVSNSLKTNTYRVVIE